VFWILQISGWLLLAAIYVLLYYRVYAASLQSFLGVMITHITGFLVTIVLRKIYQKIGYRDRSIIIISFIILIGTIVTANIWFIVDALVSKAIFGEVRTLSNLTPMRYLSLIWSNSFVIILWSALYFGIKLWNDWRSERLRAEKADALASKAQLQMLRYQLNPHFLFNSLNSIKALVEEDKVRAKSMINELSDFLRYTLVYEKLTFVPLAKELEAMRHYLAIEKTRFEEKLDVTFSIEPNTENFKVPNFIIHPLIENAIKYGMMTSALPLSILINTKLNGTSLLIKIINSGQWLDSADKMNGTGMGLSNIKKRLENAYPNKHEFKILKEKNSVCVQIVIFETNRK
jgi:two-component system LytT family sensor kinase